MHDDVWERRTPDDGTLGRCPSGRRCGGSSRGCRSRRATLVGPGDDAAVLAAPDGRYVVTTDMMVHGPDFRLAWSTPYDLGWKAAATNLSDVAAMGAVPTALVVAIAAPADTPVAELEAIADGLRDGVRRARAGLRRRRRRPLGLRRR